MSRPESLDRELADTFSKYVRAVDGVERQQLGARLDALAPLVLNQPREQCDGVSKGNEDSGEAAIHV